MSEKSEENGKYLVRENKQGMSEKKDLDEVPYAYKRIYGVFACSKKNLRYSCFKFKRKQPEFNAYKFMN